MSRRRSRFPETAAGAWLAAVAAFAFARDASAQACCAGASAVTPARLALHEDALVGLQVRGAAVLGSFDDARHYTPNPAGASELDFEQDLFGALRVLERGQVAALVPLLETRRAAQGASELGAGLGDVNLALRYDFHLAGQSRYAPGIAALGGVTFPTGRAPDASSKPLATDATGIGAYQGTLGVALEQTFGPWLVNVTGLAAKRTSRTVQGVDETLGTQLTLLTAGAYTFPNDAAVALVASYTAEGRATINGADAEASARGVFLIGAAGVWPFSDRWRVQSAVTLNPLLSGFGRNQPATGGVNLVLVRSWS